MKNKFIYLSGCITAIALMMGGCGQKTLIKNSSTNNKPESSNTASSRYTSHKQSTNLWNDSKDQQLNDFINQWAPTMHQSYTEYDGHNDLKTNTGMHYPSDFNQTMVNGTHDSIGWDPSGKGSYAYNVVAIYNDNEDGNNHITYAFAFHDGSPVALVDQSTNGVPNWSPTKNSDVESNFERIANADSSSNSADNTSHKSQSLVSVKGNLSKDDYIESSEDALNYINDKLGDNKGFISNSADFGEAHHAHADILDSNGNHYYVYENGDIKEQ